MGDTIESVATLVRELKDHQHRRFDGLDRRLDTLNGTVDEHGKDIAVIKERLPQGRGRIITADDCARVRMANWQLWLAVVLAAAAVLGVLLRLSGG